MRKWRARIPCCSGPSWELSCMSWALLEWPLVFRMGCPPGVLNASGHRALTPLIPLHSGTAPAVLDDGWGGGVTHIQPCESLCSAKHLCPLTLDSLKPPTPLPPRRFRAKSLALGELGGSRCLLPPLTPGGCPRVETHLHMHHGKLWLGII